MRPRSSPLIGLVVAAAILPWTVHCASDRCTSEPSSFQLDVSIEDLELATRVDSLSVSLEILGRSYSKSFPVGTTLADGETSLSVELDPAPTEDFNMKVVVAALENGATRARGEQVFRGHPNGCNRFELVLASATEQTDAGPADRVLDATTPGDAGPDDAPSFDLGTDAGLLDQGNVPVDPPCTARVDDDVVMLYTFDEVPAFTTTVADAREVHPAFASPAGSMVDRAPSRESCGLSVRFSGGYYLEVPNSDEFDLRSGSLDFWVSAPAPVQRGMEGLVSRDASGTTLPGHLGIYRDCQGYIIVRMQRSASPDVFRCSNVPIPFDQWAHVALNFGEPEVELYVDGELSTNTSTTQVLWNCETPVVCGQSASYGIDGNQNPFVIGAASHVSAEGLAVPVSTPLVGQIDSFRLSRIRRSF